MKKTTLFTYLFLLFSTTNLLAQTPSEILTSNIWILEKLVVDGENITIPEVVNLFDGETTAIVPNNPLLVFTAENTSEVYEVKSLLFWGSTTAYYIVSDTNIEINFDAGGGGASSADTGDSTYETFKSTYLNSFSMYGYAGGNFTIANDQLTLGSTTTYGVYNKFNPCDFMPVPTGSTQQQVTQDQTLADLNVQALEGAILNWYSDMNLTQALTENHLVVSGETYYVTQTDDQCTSQPLAITVTITAGLNNEQLKYLNVYPNPANTTLNITYKSNIEKIEFFDLSGRKVLNELSNNHENYLDISMLPSGMYLIKVYTEDGIGTQKIIKK